jgi:flotillin
MNLTPILAEGLFSSGLIIVAAVVVALVIFMLFIVVLSRYTKVGPNQVLIVSGKKHRLEDGSMVGFRIVKGGGTFVYPILEKVDILSLELLTIDVQTPEVYTSKGVPVKVDGVAQIKVKGDDVSIRTSAEQFLGKAQDEIRNIATQTLEGHLRAILGTMTVEEIYQNRDAFASKVQEVAAGDMANMGLGIVSFTIRDIRDTQGYLDALGKPRIAQVKRDAQIAQAEADRDAMIKSSQATQAGQEAKFAADSKIAEAQREYQTNVAGYQATVNQKKAEADLAYDLQKFKTGQLVKAEEVQVQIVEKQKQIELQQQEILRKQRELEANVQKPADAERYRVETLANATKFQLETEAAGAASAAKAKGFANADVSKATGLAEAEANKARGLAEAAVIEAQGKATASAMQAKADSFKNYNEAAVIEMIMRVLPEVAGKISEPLSKTEKMVIINSGNGPGGGASKVTGDVTQIIAQLPPIIESLTGIKFEKLLEQVPALKKAMSKDEPENKLKES